MKGLHVKGEGRREKGELSMLVVNLNGTILGSQAEW